MDTQKQLKQSTDKFSNLSISRARCKLTTLLSGSALLRTKRSRMASIPYQTKDLNNNHEEERASEISSRLEYQHQRKIRSSPISSPCSLSFYAIVFSFVLIAVVQENHAFQLDGSTNSFAQFRKWYTSLNGSLELDFKTEQPNGLVLYTDDGGTYDFFELKLVEGALRLRYNLGGGAQIITVGRDLHDGHWHKVQVGFFEMIFYF